MPRKQDSAGSSSHRSRLFHTNSGFFKNNSQLFSRPKFNSKYIDDDDKSIHNAPESTQTPFTMMHTTSSDSSTSPKSSRSSSYANPDAPNEGKSSLKSIFQSSISSRRSSRLSSWTPSPTDTKFFEQSKQPKSKRDCSSGSHEKSQTIDSSAKPSSSGSLSTTSSSPHKQTSLHHPSAKHPQGLPASYMGFHGLGFHGDKSVPPLQEPINPKKTVTHRSTIFGKLIPSHGSRRGSARSRSRETVRSRNSDTGRRSGISLKQTREPTKSFGSPRKSDVSTQTSCSSFSLPVGGSRVSSVTSPFGIDLDTKDDEMAEITKMSAAPMSRLSSVATMGSEAEKGESGWLPPESWKVRTEGLLTGGRPSKDSNMGTGSGLSLSSASSNSSVDESTSGKSSSLTLVGEKGKPTDDKAAASIQSSKRHRKELKGSSRSSVRVFKGDKSSVLPCTLDTTCKDILDALRRKRFLKSEEDHIIVLKCGGLTRILSYDERLLKIQRNLLFLYGYTERDNLDYIERTDLSFLFKFIVQERGVELISEEKRTLINPEHVNLANWNLQDIPNFLYAEPIVSLDVSQNPSFQFTKEFMHDCGNLRTLKFIRSGHPTFPLPIVYVPRLNDLHLEVNYIKLIPPEISKLSNLTTLNMACNRISRLPDTFSQLHSLKNLNLSSNRLKVVPPQVLSITGLKRLDLSYNSIKKLTDGLASLRNLITLQVAGNQLTGKLPEFFEKLTHLVKVDVRFNRLTSIDSLKNSSKLEVIRATGNNISVFRSNATTLFEVEMNLNPLTYVYFQSPMPNLRVVDFSKGKLTSCSFVAMLIGARTLSLDYNHLTTLPSQIDCMQRLEHFSAFKNNLNSLPESIWKLKNIKYLDFHLNNLSDLTDKIWMMQSLQYLNLASNLLETFPEPPNESEVDEDDETVVHNYPLAKTLKYLSMNDNSLNDNVIHTISKFVNLESLNLSYNEIYDIAPGFLSHLKRLKALYLSGNKLSTLPVDDFESFSGLKTLHLNGNRFHTLPAELSKLHYLTALDVGSNSLKYNISNIPYDWNWCYNKKLQYLNFSGNKRLEIKPQHSRGEVGEHLDSFIGLKDLKALGLMDVTITTDAVPDQSINVRVRSTSSQLGKFGYGISDTLGTRKVLTTRDVVIEKFRGHSDEMLITLYDGKNCSATTGDKISKIIQETFDIHLKKELLTLDKVIVPGNSPKTVEDCLRGAFLTMNSEMNILINKDASSTFSSAAAHRTQTTDKLSMDEDGYTGCCATVIYIKGDTIYLANLGDTMGILTRSDGEYKVVTTKHEPYAPEEYERIRESGGYVTTDGYLDGVSEVSRAVGYFKLIPHVTAKPSIHKFKLTANEEMIAIATSGIWKTIPFDLAADIIRQEKSNPEVAAEKLRDFAISYGIKDKATAVVLSLKQFTGKAKHREKAAQPEDSILRKLDEEIEPPTGEVAMVFTDIKNSTLLWDSFPVAMRSAIKVHNSIMRRQMRIIGGYEVKTEGDAFMVSFPTPTSALLWCFAVQSQLVSTDEWPTEILASDQGCEIKDSNGNIIYRGLSVRMGIHWGMPVCERDIVTRRMDYFGPMVNRASRVSAVADGGQISLSNDFYQEFQKILGFHSQISDGKATSMDLYHSKAVGAVIEDQISQLQQIGWVDKYVGLKKLKGLEAPEKIWLIFPKQLEARMQLLQTHNGTVQNKSDRISTGGVTSTNVWSLRQIALRLERVCNKLAEAEPVTDTLARSKFYENVSSHAEKVLTGPMAKSQNVTSVFFEHVITRIENCVMTLYLRMSMAEPGTQLVSGSISEVAQEIRGMLMELRKYQDANKAVDN